MLTICTVSISHVARTLVLALCLSTVAFAGERPTILLTGYWPPTNEMVRPFSTNPDLNPGGWIGENWEGRGYDVHSFFPEFVPPTCGSCGQGSGDLEVDYQDTSKDFWPIADGLEPIAVITFSRGAANMSWEVEMNQYNRDSWVNDYTPPLQPTRSPPDDSVPAGFLRPSQLPVTAIINAVNGSGLGLDSFICYTGDGGGFLSEFIAYHGVWYQGIHADPKSPTYCATAGHVHVGGQVSWATAREATKVTLRTVMDHLDNIELDFSFPAGQPFLIDPAGGTTIRTEVLARTKPPAPGTGTLHHSTDGVSFSSVAMQEIEPNVYDAIFPAFDCGERVFYYFSADSLGGETVLNPPGAPSATYAADAYSAKVGTFADDFESDLGWTASATGGLIDGGWERGVPAGGEFAPDTDADGSGQCFVTGLAKGQDVDGAIAMLASPIMDASDPDSILVFDQWWAAAAGGAIQLQVSDNGGARWSSVEILNASDSAFEWVRREFLVSALPIDNTDAFRMRLNVADNTAVTVEAGIDAVKIRTAFACDTACLGDLDEDDAVGFTDLLQLLAAWGPCQGCTQDLDESGDVGFGDLLTVLAAWGPCSM